MSTFLTLWSTAIGDNALLVGRIKIISIGVYAIGLVVYLVADYRQILKESPGYQLVVFVSLLCLGALLFLTTSGLLFGAIALGGFYLLRWVSDRFAASKRG
jgi:hypothetical protein